jgi:hypothetical protein
MHCETTVFTAGPKHSRLSHALYVLSTVHFRVCRLLTIFQTLGSKRFVFGPDDQYASITEKSRRLFVVSKQDFDPSTHSSIFSHPQGKAHTMRVVDTPTLFANDRYQHLSPSLCH